ncbi:U3 small nucleolar ribonucleo protein complex, subunit Mpp10 [Yarrowia lipolytica]|uniref:U3 small nucleolar ribonucleoprotein protein MPP10 n=1 Tax=Yarrowia lipolytica TaxID=4952 RepID=A0A371CE91_YARLL|nr:U3 small nucleolar ribonucleo protein complex, subunit Mpp10 [Yarrowia lipolytica]
MSGIPTIVTLDEPLSVLAVPDSELKKQALAKVKEALDPLSEQYSVLDQIHVQDMDAEMVWAQAKMVINGVCDKMIGEVFPKYGKIQPDSEKEDEEEESDDESQYESAQEEVPGEEVVGEEEDEGVDVFDDGDEDDEDDTEEDNEGSDVDMDMDNLVDDYEDEEEKEDDDEEEEEEEEDDSGGEEKPDKFGLNDGFFDIDKFNKQIMAMEADNFGEDGPDFDWNKELGEQSDDSVDDIKYDDFFGKAKFDKKLQYEQRVAKRQKLAEQALENKKDEESDDESDNEAGSDDNEADFDMEGSGDENEYEDMINSVKKDLFEEDIAEDTPEHLSTFEKQQREIMKQIAQYEKENVGEKKWTLKGEARAAQRTKDSLLEEDLDFERGAKPVPVMTQAVTESLEDMIKARIKSGQFDDLPRRFFDDLPQFKKSKLIEVSEQKSQKSLADLYEAEAMGETEPSTTNEPPNEMRDAAHREIEDLYADVAYTLDSLSSWTYKPKPTKSIQIVTNAPAISMEEAQPQALAQEEQLAPQEVYKPEVADKRERLAGSTGLPQTKAEMTREERKRAKKKEKIARGKQLAEKEERQRSLAVHSKEGDAKGSKAQVMETLKQGNVTVIGKRGEKRGLDGKLKRDQKAKDGYSLKL